MIRIQDLVYSIGDFSLGPLNLELKQGTYFVLLGPPGSGKTILLQCICGLRKIGSGGIFFNQQQVTALAPGQREIGYAPQDYAIFPHLSVRNNISFGLKQRGEKKDRIKKKVEEMADRLGVTHLLHRSAKGLSGGEQQRVALARALVLSPKLLIMDEPVSALDESLRQEVCSEIKRIQQELKVTTLHVSHNLEEALFLADQAGLIDQGQLQQTGTMGELLRAPVNEFAARFMRCENIFTGEGRGSSIQVKGATLQVPGEHQGQVNLMIRPENIQLKSKPDGRQGYCSPVKVKGVHDCGALYRVETRGELNLTVLLPFQEAKSLNMGSEAPVYAIIEKRAIHVME